MALVTRVIGDCPSCGGVTCFGNVDVYDTHLLRGCGQCSYTVNIPLPPVNKKILYLDQFFLSHAFRGSDARFIAAADRIKELASRQLLVVPYSTVHEDETHQWEHYSELLEFIKDASRGHEFAPAYDVEKVQLEKAFDSWLRSDCPQYLRESTDVFHDDIQVWESYFRIDVGQYMGDRELVRSLKKNNPCKG